ncbi:hypothetical protein Ga0100231_002575 [Opitutaceae bacterium TAV4]|nr:hypothetical protein Ga0100231_002575 [Opitutaceae bacterium TAV4]
MPKFLAPPVVFAFVGPAPTMGFIWKIGVFVGKGSFCVGSGCVGGESMGAEGDVAGEGVGDVWSGGGGGGGGFDDEGVVGLSVVAVVGDENTQWCGGVGRGDRERVVS